MALTEATEYTCPTCNTHKFKSIEVDCEEAYYPATQCSSGHWHKQTLFAMAKSVRGTLFCAPNKVFMTEMMAG